MWDDSANPDFSGRTTYYRVDFSEDSQSNQKFMDVLRNHKYIINIIDVSGNGYDDSETAFKSGPFNITTEIVSWDENLNETVWNGQNELSVNKGVFEFHATGAPQSLFVYTDYDLGWKIVEKPDWIKADITEGSANTTTEVLIESTVKNYDKQTITEGVIVIQAGTLKKNIKVTQDNALDLSIVIDPSSLTFYANGGSRSVRINVVPEDATLTFAKGSTSHMLLDIPTTMTPDNIYGFSVSAHPDVSKGPLTTSVIVTAKDANGNERQEVLQVTQYGYNLLFEFMPWTHPAYGSKYPPKGHGEESLYFYTQTSRAWEYKQASYAGFTPLSNLSQQPSENTPREFFFELLPNDAWADRSVTVTVTTTDANIPSYDFTFWQTYTMPFIEVTRPVNSPKVIDFGSDNTGNMSAEIEFVSNAKWNMNSSGSYYDKIISSATWVSDGDSGSSLARNPHEITLENKKLTVGAGIPKAGLEVSATINLSTADHSPAPAFTSEDITVKRIIPAFFDFKSVSPAANSTLTRTGASVTVYAATNDEWTLSSSNLSGSQPKMNADVWGDNKYLTAGIANNDTWRERDVTVTYTQTGKAPETLNYKQSGAYTTSGSVTGSIAGTGGSATLRVYGDYPANSVRFKATSVNSSTATTVIHTNTSSYLTASSGGSQTATVYIGANTGSARTAYFWYQDGASAEWKPAGSLPQAAGYNYSVTTNPVDNSVLDGNWAEVTLSITGNRPAVTVYVKEGDGTNEGKHTFDAGSNSLSQTISISDNPSHMATRTITITCTGTDGKSQTFTFTQQAANHQLTGGRIVAKKDISGILSWTEAMGIDIKYNDDIYYTSYNGNMDNRSYTPNKPTGCAVYSESSTDVGK